MTVAKYSCDQILLLKPNGWNLLVNVAFYSSFSPQDPPFVSIVIGVTKDCMPSGTDIKALIFKNNWHILKIRAGSGVSQYTAISTAGILTCYPGKEWEIKL